MPKGGKRNGKAKGHGVLYGNDTLIEYEGNWANDKFNGEGRQYN